MESCWLGSASNRPDCARIFCFPQKALRTDRNSGAVGQFYGGEVNDLGDVENQVLTNHFPGRNPHRGWANGVAAIKDTRDCVLTATQRDFE